MEFSLVHVRSCLIYHALHEVQILIVVGCEYLLKYCNPAIHNRLALSCILFPNVNDNLVKLLCIHGL